MSQQGVFAFVLCTKTVTLPTFVRNILLLLTLTLLTNEATAQRAEALDYLVTTAGDTLRGHIKPTGAGGVKLYRRGQPTQEFSPAEVRSYGNDHGPIGISQVVGRGGQPRFMSPLVSGYVSLYKGEEERREKQFFVQVPDSGYVREVALVSHQLTLARTLRGCPALEFGTNAFQRTYPYTIDGMSRLVIAYNACRQPEQTTALVKRRSSGWHAAVGFKVGPNYSSIQLSGMAQGYDADDHRDAFGYQGGFTLNVAAPINLSAQLEVNFARMRSTYGPYSVALGYNSGIPGDIHTATLRYSQVQVPLLLRYEIGHGGLRPFVNAGPSYVFNFDNSSFDATSTFGSGTREFALTVDKAAFGVVAGGGVLLRPASGPTLSLEARYSYVEHNSIFVGPTPRSKTASLELGIMF